MSKKVTPVFLFALPRSGSTLLLKVLSAHEKIASVSEPYLLLPFCYATKKEGVFAEYSHILSSRAINNVIENLPHKKKDYNRYLAEFTQNIYSDLCKNNETYFLDKTPVYSYIIKDIYELFPDAKYIFLFRNPVQVFASIMTTFNNNRFYKNYRRHNQLVYGPEMLANGYKLLQDKAYLLTYEDFVLNPKEQLQKIMQYLDLEFNENMLTHYLDQDLKGGMGDPIGVNSYSSIIPKSIDKWKTIFNTKSRKRILLNYINNISEHFFTASGYDRQQIIQEINAIKGSIGLRNIQDVTEYNLYQFVIKTKLHLITSKAYKWSKNVYVN